MKLYISVDIEGVTGVTSWNETELGNDEHAAAAEQMTLEALAACEGAIEWGADEIYIKDAHDSARNLDITRFPENVHVIRGWTCTPESMMAGIDSSFDAAVFIGYHSGAGSDGSPLAHTMNRDNNWVKINGRQISEFDLNAYVAAYYGVPVVFLSGDEALCGAAGEIVPEIETVSVKKGIGKATFNIAPQKACRLISEGVKAGLSKLDKCAVKSPESFEMEINFKEHAAALRGSFYPGAEQTGPKTVRFTGKDIQEMMAARMFIL
ncbi:MAG: M55 family metallopeptidase [Lachnospiraceae bacterium]|nr:M55 family metallopeptidase [Lachnospiraceae bacterium]